MEIQKAKDSYNSLEQKKVGGFALLDIKIYKAAAIKTVRYLT